MPSALILDSLRLYALSEFNQGGEGPAGGAGVQRLGCDFDSFHKISSLARRHQSRGGVGQNDVAIRPALAVEHAAKNLRVGLGVAPLQSICGDARQAKVLGKN